MHPFLIGEPRPRSRVGREGGSADRLAEEPTRAIGSDQRATTSLPDEMFDTFPCQESHAPRHGVLAEDDHPPSTGRVTPVMPEAAGEATNTAASATSCEATGRPSGVTDPHHSKPAGHASARPGRSMSPAAIALTRAGANSPAAAAVSESRAAFDAA